MKVYCAWLGGRFTRSFPRCRTFVSKVETPIDITLGNENKANRVFSSARAWTVSRECVRRAKPKQGPRRR